MNPERPRRRRLPDGDYPQADGSLLVVRTTKAIKPEDDPSGGVRKGRPDRSPSLPPPDDETPPPAPDNA